MLVLFRRPQKRFCPRMGPNVWHHWPSKPYSPSLSKDWSVYYSFRLSTILRESIFLWTNCHMQPLCPSLPTVTGLTNGMELRCPSVVLARLDSGGGRGHVIKPGGNPSQEDASMHTPWGQQGEPGLLSKQTMMETSFTHNCRVLLDLLDQQIRCPTVHLKRGMDKYIYWHFLVHK